MKGKYLVLENEKYFGFSKWTKINVQISVAEKVLTDEFFRFCVWTFIVLNQIINFLFVIEKKLKFFMHGDLGVFYIDNISMKINDFYPKKPHSFVCEKCLFITCNKKDYTRHIMTKKHIINHSQCISIEKPQKNPYECICGKIYKENSGLWRHKKLCKFNETIDKNKLSNCQDKNHNLIEYLMKENKEIKEMILEIVKNGITNTNTNSHNTITTHTNSHNKAFNLNFFLNETCKNAMNITDFVESIKLQLCDLMEVGEIGYVEGISKIIVKNLNNLDETIRPIHCTDKKRETMYIKDQGEWNKEDEKKTKLKKAINKIADKNIRLLPQFREKYPEYGNSSSKTSDIHDKLVVEIMETDEDKKEKIIKNISKATIIQEN